MAIIACKECGQQVSDQAASCPNCGAPIAARAAPKPRASAKRVVYGGLITLAVLCGIAAAVWIAAPHELIGMLGRSDHTAVHSRAIEQLVTVEPVAAVTRSRETVPPPRLVYVTTAEQLYQDYSANAVATQSKIGNSRVRISGSVAEIDEDASGHPVVKLWTSNDDSADMMLSDDQRAPAAQLVKGEAIDVECDKIKPSDPMQHRVVAPQGSGCTLVLVDAGSKQQAYLALYFSAERGMSQLYVVGPMAKDACLARSDGIWAHLRAGLKREHFVSKNCASTASESVPADGCRLSASMSAIPDMPTAHLWRYDCAAAPAAPSKATTTTAGRKSRPSAAAATDTDLTPLPDVTVEDVDAPPPATTPAPGQNSRPNPAPAVVAVAPLVTAAAATTAAPTAAAAAPAAAVTPVMAATAAPVNAATSVAAASSTSPATAAAAPVGGAPDASVGAPNAAAIPADLMTVKASDPGAAQHIVSYCNTATASASDPASVAAGCRHEEAAAWDRLVVHNEFPALDDTTRRKCSEPPFPDSYVAKESCAKYLLHSN